jgi:two-component system sensor kinase FixL
MNWVDIAWIMMMAASAMLGVVHLFVWQKQPVRYANLMFFVLAVSGAAYGAFELARMGAMTPSHLADLIRWSHVPLAMFIIAAVGFIRFYFDAGRMWLAGAVIAARLLALVLNFSTGVNVNYLEITGVSHLQLWGGAEIVGPIGVRNPMAVVPQLSNLLLVAFIIDASITLWRRGGAVARRRAALVGGSLALCVATVGTLAALVVAGVVHAPTFLMPGFFIVVLAMGYELVWDLIAAAQLSEQLRAGERRFRAVVEAVPSAILLVGEGGAIALANAQAETVFGYSRSELVGKPVDMLLPERLRRTHAGFRQAYAMDAQTRMMGNGRELHARRKDGSEIPVEIAMNPMPAEERASVLLSVVDITNRIQAERVAARQRDEVAHLSRVAMLGELAGSLAHELNQPLTAILSNAQAAQRFLNHSPPRVDQLAEILADIVKNDHRAGAVIQRLRSMLRKEEAQHTPLDVDDVVQESLRLMRSDLLNRHIAVSADLAHSLPKVTGDRNQLQQVLLNLMINGCDAMEGQSPTGRLLVRTQRNTEGKVEISVADSGVGIPPADLERIFEPFMTTKAQGLGLGLPICRSIVEGHGGRLWATNNVDRGVTLHCELPVLAS